MEKRSNLSICMRLLKLVKPLAEFMFLAVGMGIAGYLCASFLTILGVFALLSVLQVTTVLSLKMIFILLAVFAVCRGFLRYGEQACNHFIAFKLLALIRDKVFRALRRLCPAKLEGKEKGNLISVITSDIELLEVFYAHTISPVLIAVCTSVFMCLFIGRYHWALGGLAATSYFFLGCILPGITSRMSGGHGADFRKQTGELGSYVLDSLRGLEENIQYQMGEERLNEMNERADKLSEEEKQMKKLAGNNQAVIHTAVLVLSLVMLLISSFLFQKQLIGFEGILISTVALMTSFGPVIALANLSSTLQSTMAAGNRVLDILDEMPLTEDITDQPEQVFSGARLQHVEFGYGDEKILSDISLSISKNQIIGITGKSGSGKSTLLKLLMRFWERDQGSITISDTDINCINTLNLRNMESFVTQETYLFHDSIENNIRIAKPDASREEIEKACRKASVHDFIISLPNGYQTNAGELGDALSGGERQRIGLARAFLHEAPFILLDEPTSNLDSLNEGAVLKALCQERSGKTMVLVSHRPSTMKIADYVCPVEHGRVS